MPPTYCNPKQNGGIFIAKLIVAEKPSVAMAYAKVLGATNRQDGYLEGNGYLVSWCVGHLVELRQIVKDLIDQQLNDFPDEDIKETQAKLNAAYDAFTAKYGLLNDRKNGRLFEQDSSYYLLCSLENLDEQGQLKSKAAMQDSAVG